MDYMLQLKMCFTRLLSFFCEMIGEILLMDAKIWLI